MGDDVMYLSVASEGLEDVIGIFFMHIANELINLAILTELTSEQACQVNGASSRITNLCHTCIGGKSRARIHGVLLALRELAQLLRQRKFLL